jgi:hypothetical protein
MSVHFAPPPAVDLLEQAIEHVRPHLDRGRPVGERLRSLWAAVVAARDISAADVVKAQFVQLADDVGLRRDLGRHADEDLQHVISWGLLEQNPFQ